MVDETRNDHAARALPFFWSWGLPLAILFSTNCMSMIVSMPIILMMMSGSFFWMGLACVLNARRCRRRHCYYSGPIFIAGGAGVLLDGHPRTTQKTPATTYFPEGLPPEYLRRWRA